MKLNSLHDVLLDNLRDLYNAEQQLVKALPKMSKAASSTELREAIDDHLEETRRQVERLEQVFESIGEKAKGKVCMAMQGLIEEGSEVIKAADDDNEQAIDAALIAAAQRVEHYEISAYGSCRAFAQRLGLSDAVELLQQTLDEEKQADERLGDLAESGINDMAVDAEGDGSQVDFDTTRPVVRRSTKSRMGAASKRRGSAASNRS